MGLLNRVQLIDDAMDLAKSGDVDYSLPLGIIQYVKRETQYLPWRAALAGIGQLDRLLQGSALYGPFKVGNCLYLLLYHDRTFQRFFMLVGKRQTSQAQSHPVNGQIPVFRSIYVKTFKLRTYHSCKVSQLRSAMRDIFLFQSYVRGLLGPIYNETSRRELEQTPKNLHSIKLKSLVASWACKLNFGDCRAEATHLFRQWMSSPNPDEDNPYVWLYTLLLFSTSLVY